MQYECKVCKKVFIAKESAKRKFCSLSCSVVYKNKQTEGKTYEEMYGIERAKQIKHIHSEALKLNTIRFTNGIKGGSLRGKQMLGKNFEQLHGQVKADLIKQQISKTLKGKPTEEIYQHGLKGAIGRMIKYPGNFIKGKRGYINSIRFESSFEEKFLLAFFSMNFCNALISRSLLMIRYYYNGKLHTYFPDFQININGINIIIEVKCEKLLKAVDVQKTHCKMEALQKFCIQHNYLPCMYTEKHFKYANL